MIASKMFRIGLKCLIGIAFFALTFQKSTAQCLRIETILVDSCDNSGDEGFNEMFSFVVGPAPLNLSQMSVNWPSQSWQGLAQNSITATKVAALNTQIAGLGGCGRLIEPTGTIPANASVIVITSYNFSPSANVFGALTHDVYILFQDNATVTAGHFGNFNANPGIRTLSVSFGGGCSVSVSYDRSLLVDANGLPAAGNGASVTYNAAGNPTYTNLGCVAPVDVFSVDAGTVSSACTGATVAISGTAQGQSSVSWSAPTGSFSNPNSLNTNYTLPFTASGSVTLTLTATNACGNSIQDTVTLNVTAGTTPTFTQPAAICSGESLTALPTTSLNGITGTWTPPLDNTQTKQYTFTPNAGQCATTKQLTITVNPSIVPSFTPVASICAGQPLSALPTTSNNGITGSWSPPLDNTQTTDYTFTPDAGQCAATATLRITVTPGAVPTFTQVPPVCNGSTIMALPTVSLEGITGSWQPPINNTLTTTYTFTPDLGQCTNLPTQMTITVTSTNITPTFTQIGPICINQTLSPLPTTSLEGITGTWSPAPNNLNTTRYTFTPNSGQCANTAIMDITVNNPVTPTFTQVAPICSGDALLPLPTTSNDGITGTWSPALDNTQTTRYTFTPLAGSCASVAFMNIQVQQPTVPTFNPIAPICAGQTLTALPTTSLNGITGTWSPALDNTQTTDYTFTPTTGQCAARATLRIVVNPVITPTFTQVAPICVGQSLSALPTTSNNGITGVWTPPLDNTQTTRYTFTPNAGQCATSVDMTIAVNNPSIVPIFTQVAPICTGQNLSVLPTTSNNGITGTWSPAMNNLATTRYNFTPNPGQCALPTFMDIVVTNANVLPTFNPVAPICSGEFLSPLPTTSLNGITGSWSPTLSNTRSDIYTFTPNPGQCALPTQIGITVVNNVLPLFDILTPVCSGNFVAPLPTTSLNGITGTWSPPIDNTQTTVYTFTPNAGQCALPTQLTQTIIVKTVPSFATQLDVCQGGLAPILSNISPNGITGTWSPAVIDNQTDGIYVFTPSAVECATQTSLEVIIQPNPVYAQTSYICSDAAGLPLTQSFLDTGLSTADYTFVWTQNGQPLTANSSAYLATSVGNYQVVATENISGCTVTYLFAVLDSPPATAEVYVGDELADQQQIVVITSGGSGQFLYQLNDGAFQTDNTFVVTQGGDYLVHVKDISGCNSFDLPVTVLGYPKFFTPNNDGYNDTWNIDGLKSDQKGQISIFDRYGKLLKQFSAHSQGWDGTYNGALLPATDYWFVIDYQTSSGNERTFKAHFSLKR